MRMISYGTCTIIALILFTITTGCGSQDSTTDAPVEVTGLPPASGEHDHEDEHEGPHGGHVIELGRSHEYHAELVENEKTAMVTVYMLDKDMKELSISQLSIAMNLMVEGQAQSFELSAVEATNGSASRFDATDKSLFEALHEHEASGKLRVTINGSPYSGEVEHHHDHDEDDDHGHEDGHKH